MESKFNKINIQSIGDYRGYLIPLESNINVPFEIKRVYYIYKTKTNVRRGFHSHKKLKQLVTCISGSCTFLLDDGNSKTNIMLDNPNQGILIEGLIWREMYDFSEDCVLLVLASEYYDESDYIRNYNEFLKVAKNEKE